MSSEDRNRRYKRYYYKTPLVLEESRELSLESINISQGGIFFRSSELLEINKSLSLSFVLPGKEETIEAQCSVIHNLETIPSRQYFVGVRFIKILRSSIEDLGTYLRNYFDQAEL